MSNRLQARTKLVPRFKQPATMIVGAALLGFLVLIAVLAPIMTSYDPLAVDTNAHLLPPSSDHWLGTDYAGRDAFSRLLHSIRLAYGSGVVAVVIIAILGTLLGLLAGYRGGWVDVLMMRFVDVWLALPGLLAVLMLVALLGNDLWQIVVAIGLAGAPSFARLVRGLTIHQKSQPYVESARAIGASPQRIVLRHILPNILPEMSTLLAVRFGGAILTAGSLSFLGLGVQPPVPELGNLLSEGREVIRYSWWLMVGPLAVLWMTMLGANLISDSLAEIR